MESGNRQLTLLPPAQQSAACYAKCCFPDFAALQPGYEVLICTYNGAGVVLDQFPVEDCEKLVQRLSLVRGERTPNVKFLTLHTDNKPI